jgi:hemerythrin
MPITQWSSRLSVGVKAFDEDHARLIGLLNQLYDAVQARKGGEHLRPILDGLVRYVKGHFAREEQIMTLHGYPDRAAHKAEHDEFARRVLDVCARQETGKASVLSAELLNVLASWLVTHIQGSDQGYGAFLTARGVS